MDRKKVLTDWMFNTDLLLTQPLMIDFKNAFINRFLFSEIGYETPALFRDRVNCDIISNADYYNRVWQLNKILSAWDFMEDDIHLSSKEDERIIRGENERNDRIGNTSRLDTSLDQRNDLEEYAEERGQNQDTTRQDKNSMEEESNENRQNNGTITDQRDQSTLGQKKENNAKSDFPQGNINTGKDYYTEGYIGNNLDNSQTEDHAVRMLADGYTGTGNRTGNNQADSLGNIRDLASNRYMLERDNRNINNFSSALKDMINDVIEHAIQQDRGNKQLRHGRTQRRQVPELVEMLRNGYINVPMIMTDDLAKHFMGIW